MLSRTRLQRAGPTPPPPSRQLGPANDATIPQPIHRPRWLPALAPPRLSSLVSDTELRRRMPLERLSFIIIVALPIGIAALYYLVIAADQYVAEFRFSLRATDAPRPIPAWSFDSNAAPAPTQAEAQIVVQYIGSRAIIDDLEKQLPLRAMFASSAADWWARLSDQAPIETLVQYWRHQVDAFYEPSNGTATVRARAFTPQDSLQLAQAIVGAAEALVNQLSERARRDVLHHATEEVTHAEARLTSALGKIREFRDREGLIDPGKTADATASIAARLRDELVRAQAELSTLKTYMRDDSPEIRVLKARIRSLDAERHAAVQGLTDDSKLRGDAPPASLAAFEQLESERRFAETAYQHALEALDRARAEADRQQLYVASFVPPSLPEEALYPRRWRSLGTVALIAFAVWGIGGLTLRSIREHL
jgi:capsular polysaccharide transport system permease protein